MKARYIGGESLPGSGETIVFGKVRVRCGEIFDVPVGMEHKARMNRFFEVIEDDVAQPEEKPDDAPKARRGRKAKESDEADA